MDLGIQCRCCLVRAPDRDLKTIYLRLGKTEVYADMLKDCFEIQISMTGENDSGICEVCISRLRDACSFKQQVQRCQQNFENARLTVKASLHDGPSWASKRDRTIDEDYNVKVEMDVESDGNMESDLKEEYFDGEDLSDDDKTVEFIGVNKRTSARQRKKKLDTDFENCSGKSPRKKSKLNLRAKKAKPPEGGGLKTERKKHRANMRNIMKHSNCTPFLFKTIAGIFCLYCKENFKDLNCLKEHIVEKHKSDHENFNHINADRSNVSFKIDITDLSCTLCGEKVGFISDLKKHLTKQHDIFFYPGFDYILEFKLTDGEKMNCALCHSSFETFKMLLQHMNLHYRNFICDECDMGFLNKDRLLTHKKSHVVGSFKCSMCDKVFVTQVRRMCHEKVAHSNRKREVGCPHCDKVLPGYIQRNRHMIEEHNLPAATYKCNICDKSFILKSQLTNHTKKFHLMERNHMCSVCGQGFFRQVDLKDHMIKHVGEKVHKCMVCMKAYARKKTLREHMKIHNNDRRFKCGLCGLAFVQNCSLKSHILSNHGMTLAEFESISNKVNTESTT